MKNVIPLQQPNIIDGLKLQNIRRSKKYTQEELSELSGVSVNSIKRLEQGIGDCKISTLTKLANALGISDFKELFVKKEGGHE